MQPDYSRRFLFTAAQVRGEFVRFNSAWSELQASAQLPDAVAPWVAKALAGNALAASTIKFDGQLSLQVQSEGPIRLLVAQCSSFGTVRAMAQYTLEGEAEQSPLSSLHQAFGEGSLALSLARQGEGDDYNGMVPLEGETLEEALAFYFSQSEQLETCFFFGFDGQQVAGLLLQRLPGDADDHDGWNRIQILADTLTESELLNLEDTVLLQRLFSEEDITLFEPKDLTFACVCSRERIARMIVGLGEAEAQDIVQEQGAISVTCEFCRQSYAFSPEQVSGLFDPDSEGSTTLH